MIRSLFDRLKDFLSTCDEHPLSITHLILLQEMSKLSLKCLSTMLVNHSHFNYRGDIINTIVPFMNHSNQEVGLSKCMKGVSNGS